MARPMQQPAAAQHVMLTLYVSPCCRPGQKQDSVAKQTSKPTSPGLICSDTPFSTRTDGRAGYEKSAQADGCALKHTCADGQSKCKRCTARTNILQLHAPTKLAGRKRAGGWNPGYALDHLNHLVGRADSRAQRRKHVSKVLQERA